MKLSFSKPCKIVRHKSYLCGLCKSTDKGISGVNCTSCFKCGYNIFSMDEIFQCITFYYGDESDDIVFIPGRLSNMEREFPGKHIKLYDDEISLGALRSKLDKMMVLR